MCTVVVNTVKNVHHLHPELDYFIIIVKTSTTGQSGKNKIVHQMLSQPQAPAARKTEENTTQGSNQRLTAPLNPSSVPMSNTMY